MVKRCIYCGKEVNNDSVIDFCEVCGVSAFGEKTFKAIIQNMRDAEIRGDLNQGSVSLKRENL
jgi:uncharacterized UBP type Zn finger protein